MSLLQVDYFTSERNKVQFSFPAEETYITAETIKFFTVETTECNDLISSSRVPLYLRRVRQTSRMVRRAFLLYIAVFSSYPYKIESCEDYSRKRCDCRTKLPNDCTLQNVVQ